MSIAVEALGEPRIEEYSESAWFEVETLCPTTAATHFTYGSEPPSF
jgi:hypothetical protein